MKSFEELEKQHRHSPVHADDPHLSNASGVLSLARNQTEVVLSLPKPFNPVRDDSGFFDLHLRAGNGASVLLQKALSLGTTSTSHGSSEVAYVEKIYPNIVALNAQNLGQDALINSISYSFPALRYFFHYQYLERIGVHDAGQKELAMLKKLRRKKKDSSDFFRPMDLYVVHKPHEHLIKFKIDDRQYSVFPELRSGIGWGNIDVQTQPIATIKFGKSVSIDEALDHVWEWRRFFEQIALQPFSVDAISVRSKGCPPYRSSYLYLPNVTEEKTDIHSGDVPLNLWGDRSQLTEAMQKWLSKEDERRLFRVSIARVIDRSRKRVSLDDIVTMCAAIESLPELKGESSISHSQIETLTTAAQTAATEHDIKVDPARIRNLLDMLRHQSLPRRLKLLGGTLQPHIPKADMELIIEAVRGLRTVAAHGQMLSEINLPKIWPSVQALLAVCILYDLTTCSVPVKTYGDSHIMAMKQVREAIYALKQLKSSRTRAEN